MAVEEADDSGGAGCDFVVVGGDDEGGFSFVVKGAEEIDDEGEPFNEKMTRLVSELDAQFAESANLENWSPAVNPAAPPASVAEAPLLKLRDVVRAARETSGVPVTDTSTIVVCSVEPDVPFIVPV